MQAAYRRIPVAAAAVVTAVIVAACAAATSVLPSPSGGSPTGNPTASAIATEPATPEPSRPSDIGQVVADEPLVLRSQPGTGTDSTILEARLHPGMRFRILEGPITASGYDWYRVRVGSLEGWAAAGTRDGEPYEPWLARVENGPIAVGRGGSGAASGMPQVFLVEPDGTELGQLTLLADEDLELGVVRRGNLLTLTCGTGIYGLAWSADGGRLAFALGSCDSAVYLVDSDGGAQHRVGEGRTLAWSPDGQRVSFSLNFPYLPEGCLGDAWDLQVVEAAGGAAVPVTHNDACVTAVSPDWSPDGTSIAFAAGSLGADSDGKAIWRVDLATGRETLVADGHDPRWSPDGTLLLVQRIVDDNGADPGCGGCRGAIFAVTSDGSAERSIGTGYDAEWSPAGDRVAFWNGYETSAVVVTDADGSNPVTLDRPGRFAGWSPDGREVLIADDVELWRYPLDGGAPVSLGTMDSAAAWQPLLDPILATR